MIKQALYFQPKRALHVIELELIFKKIILDLNNKPVLLRQSQDSFISISRMDLLGKFYYPSEGGLFKTSKTILRDIELIEDCAQEGRMIFNEIYTEKLREYSTWKYEGLIPEVGDIVGVPDKEAHGEPRMGRIIELISPHEAKIEMARPRKGHPYPEEEVTTKKVTFRRSPHSIYLIERPKEHLCTLDMRNVESGMDLPGYNGHNGVEKLPSIREVEEVQDELTDKVGGDKGQNQDELGEPIQVEESTKEEVNNKCEGMEEGAPHEGLAAQEDQTKTLEESKVKGGKAAKVESILGPIPIKVEENTNEEMEESTPNDEMVTQEDQINVQQNPKGKGGQMAEVEPILGRGRRTKFLTKIYQ